MSSNQLAITIFILACVALVQQSSCQDVDLRTNDKTSVEGGVQSRTIYASQRQLSPHRMMHFGKRPAFVRAPMLMVRPEVFDLYQPPASVGFSRQVRSQPAHFRDELLSFTLDNGRILQAVPDDGDFQPTLTPQGRGYTYNTFDDIGSLLREPMPSPQGSLAQQQADFDPGRFMRLMQKEANPSGGDSAETGSGDAANSNESNESGQQPAAIEVSSRSVPPTRGNTLHLPKSLLSSLYGSQSQSYSQNAVGNSGGYNKKAAGPKSNLFMHFG